MTIFFCYVDYNKLFYYARTVPLWSSSRCKWLILKDLPWDGFSRDGLGDGQGRGWSSLTGAMRPSYGLAWYLCQVGHRMVLARVLPVCQIHASYCLYSVRLSVCRIHANTLYMQVWMYMQDSCQNNTVECRVICWWYAGNMRVFVPNLNNSHSHRTYCGMIRAWRAYIVPTVHTVHTVQMVIRMIMILINRLRMILNHKADWFSFANDSHLHVVLRTEDWMRMICILICKY